MGKKNKTKKTSAIIVSIIIILSITLLIIVFNKNAPKIEIKNKIAVIPIMGVITSGNGDGSFFSQPTLSSSTIVSFIEAANNDNNIKGIILNINSPGGAVVPSKEVVDSIKKVNKPVVALIRDVGASGAYWIASAADHIVADPLSITGSIGVIGSYLEFSDLFGEYGIKYQSIISGKDKDLGSPYTNLTNEQRVLLEGKLAKIHKYFIDDVNKNRKKNLTPYATGLFYLGIEAKEIGLIDELGGKEEAINATLKLANITNYELAVFRKERTIFDLLQRVTSNFGYSIGQGLGSEFKA
ncbi:MAG: signal peptide peptidase SppA, partial [Nanoarchaeota archaeon]